MRNRSLKTLLKLLLKFILETEGESGVMLNRQGLCSYARNMNIKGIITRRENYIKNILIILL